MSYPKLFLRVKGMLLDSVVFAVMLISLIFVSMVLEIESMSGKILLILMPIVFFEPLLVRVTGGSLGHHYAGIKIQGKLTGKNLGFHKCVLRFIVKTILGICSFASMLITSKHQAVHDYLSGSVVVFKDANNIPEHHKLVERATVYTARKPSVLRRLVVIIAFSILWLTLMSIVVNLVVAHECLDKSICSDMEEQKLVLTSSIILFGFLMIVILGCMSKLPGAYFKRVVKPKIHKEQNEPKF